MNRKAHRSGPVERPDSQLKILKIRQIVQSCIRAYKRPPVGAEQPMKKHHYPGLCTSDIYMRPGQDQDSDVGHRLCSKWRPPAQIQARI